jgi:hypothetical protein
LASSPKFMKAMPRMAETGASPRMIFWIRPKAYFAPQPKARLRRFKEFRGTRLT